MNKKLYLDDIRVPRTKDWVIVRSYKEFVDWITLNGLPDEISFDHDLSDVKEEVLDFDKYQDHREMTGYDCAKWLCEYCLDNGLPIPKWNVHSANTVGKQNIDGILNNYKRELN